MTPIFALIQMLLWWALFATGGFVIFLFLLLTNTEARFFFMERFRKGGAVLALHNEGTVTYSHVKADAGVLVGNPRVYYPLPALIRKPNEEEKKYNDLLKHRSILRGLKKPIYHASQATSLVANPRLLEELEGSDIKKDNTEVVLPWSIENLVEKVNRSFPPTTQKRAYLEGYNVGLGYRPPKDYKKIIIPLGVALVLFFMVLVLMKGNFNLSNLYTRFAP